MQSSERQDDDGLKESYLRKVRTLGAETHENWIEACRHLDMNLLWEHKKQELMKLAV